MRLDTVVAIGSGPADSVSGEDIDRHLVVRMWNHEWQPAERYGSRYDYGLITSIHDVEHASKRPEKAWLLYNAPRHEHAPEIEGIPVVELDRAGWLRRAKAVKAKSADGRALKFTRGFCAVAGAIECLRPKRVAVLGMDILQNGLTGAKYYDPKALPFYVKSFPTLAEAKPSWATDEMPAGLSGAGPHDYSAEAAMIRTIAAGAEVELVWGSV